MDWLGLSHFVTAIAALFAGALVVLRRKGTKFHRWLGRGYAMSMLLLNATALGIYDLLGEFGPFHVAAIFSLITVIMGVRSAWLRHKNWRISHAYWMSWSYVGLLAAAASETSTRYLGLDFGWTVAIATLVVIALGSLVINRRLPPLLGLN